MDGILRVYHSDTPQNPRSQTYGVNSSDTAEPQPKRRKRSDQAISKKCRRGESYPNSTGRDSLDQARRLEIC